MSYYQSSLKIPNSTTGKVHPPVLPFTPISSIPIKINFSLSACRSFKLLAYSECIMNDNFG